MIWSRFLFLDFDGVLVSRKSLSRGDDRIDPECIAQLERVYRETGCAVVVSSTWRLGRTRRELAAILERRGYTGPVVDVTPEFRNEPRGREIAAWVALHGVDVARVAIVDDDSDMAELLPRHVKTEFESGLVAADADRLITLLREAGPARVQRRRRRGWKMPAHATYVGRPGWFGNPYRAHPGTDPEHAIGAYRTHIEQRMLHGDALLMRIRGADLACWCPPAAACHADVLLELVNR